jgi:hypothetical protein
VLQESKADEEVYNANDKLIGVQYVAVWEEGRSDDGSSFCSSIDGRLLWRCHSRETWFNTKGQPVPCVEPGGNDLGVDEATGLVSEYGPTTDVAGNRRRSRVQEQKRRRRLQRHGRGNV